MNEFRYVAYKEKKTTNIHGSRRSQNHNTGLDVTLQTRSTKRLTCSLAPPALDHGVMMIMMTPTTNDDYVPILLQENVLFRGNVLSLYILNNIYRID